MTLWTRAHQAPLCPWDSPGKNTGMGCHFFLQGIFPTRGSNPCLLQWQMDSLPLSQQGSPCIHLIPSNPCFSFRHANSWIYLLYYMFWDIFLLQYYFGQCDISVLVLHWRLCCDYLIVYLHAVFELLELGPCCIHLYTHRATLYTLHYMYSNDR